MALIVGVESYCTLAEAAAYWAARLAPAAWVEADDARREQALRMACGRLERYLYVGAPTGPDQRLKWPRRGVRDEHGALLESSAVPQCVKDAQAEEAAWLLMLEADGGAQQRALLQAQGVKSVSLDGVSESYTGRPAPGLGNAARALVGRYFLRAPRRVRGL